MAMMNGSANKKIERAPRKRPFLIEAFLSFTLNPKNM